jgi:hypothetical protein
MLPSGEMNGCMGCNMPFRKTRFEVDCFLLMEDVEFGGVIWDGEEVLKSFF